MVGHGHFKNIYIYVWKLNQTVLELDFRALSNFCSSLDGIWTHTIDTLQHHSLSLTSSALDHSTTSTPLYIHVFHYLILSYFLHFTIGPISVAHLRTSPWPTPVEDHCGHILIVRGPHTPGPILIVQGPLWFWIYYVT
jgi:hypothetical protein